MSSPINVTGRAGNAPNNATVSVNIVHPFRGDLMVDLVAQDGSVYRLRPASFRDSADNVVATYIRSTSSESLTGVWRLRVKDFMRGDTGHIDSWSIRF